MGINGEKESTLPLLVGIGADKLSRRPSASRQVRQRVRPRPPPNLRRKRPPSPWPHVWHQPRILHVLSSGPQTVSLTISTSRDNTSLRTRTIQGTTIQTTRPSRWNTQARWTCAMLRSCVRTMRKQSREAFTAASISITCARMRRGCVWHIMTRATIPPTLMCRITMQFTHLALNRVAERAGHDFIC